MIRAFPDENEHQKSFKAILTPNENILTSEATLKHLKMEEEHIKANAPPIMAFVSKGSRGKHALHDKKPKKGPCLLQNSHSKGGSAKKHKVEGTGAKDIARVKCYNCGKKGNSTRDCPGAAKYLFPIKLINYMFFPMHSLLTLFINGLYIV